jgi:hypothetical protein
MYIAMTDGRTGTGVIKNKSIPGYHLYTRHHQLKLRRELCGTLYINSQK